MAALVYGLGYNWLSKEGEFIGLAWWIVKISTVKMHKVKTGRIFNDYFKVRLDMKSEQAQVRHEQSYW